MGTAPTLIHTLIPADAESNSFPSSSAGEYFLATQNPSSGTTSDQLAFWTWTMIVNKMAQNNVTVSTFTPGCYDTTNVESTFCVPEKDSTTVVDGLGDRLMSRLAYRYFSPCDEHATLATSCEYLAVTQTVQEDSNTQRTGVRYYTLIAPSSATASPTVLYSGDFSDSGDSLFYWMPSNGIDKDQNVGYTFSVGNGSTYPSLYYDTLDGLGAKGTAQTVPGLSFTGSENGSPNDGNQFWGEYVSTTIDPKDDLTFFSIGGYYPADQAYCTSSASPAWNGCSWYTAIFSCKKGDANCP